LRYNHHKLPTFGVGKDRRAAEWRSIFRQLSATGLIQQDFLEHGRWFVTDAGWQVLKGGQRIELRKEMAQARTARREKRAAAATVVVGDADNALLTALKGLRARLAQTQRVPAYVVFSDRTLIELATHRPDSLRAMREIHGVGDAKLERYGTAFLEIILRSGSP
jgi:ATP-dependent DNA helicase RecQ